MEERVARLEEVGNSEKELFIAKMDWEELHLGSNLGSCGSEMETEIQNSFIKQFKGEGGKSISLV